MATEGNIGLAEPSTLTKSVRTFTQTINSSALHMEGLTLVGQESSLAIAQVVSSNAASTVWGLVTRSAAPSLTTYAASTVGQSSATTIVSSNATTVGYVQSYQLTSTMAGPVTGGFYINSTLVWPVLIWAGGGIARDGQSASYPGYLFKGTAAKDLTFNVSSTGAYQLAVTYWEGI